MGMSTLKYVDNPLFTLTNKKVAVPAMFIPASKGNLQSPEHSMAPDARVTWERFRAILGIGEGNPPAIGGFSP